MSRLGIGGGFTRPYSWLLPLLALILWLSASGLPASAEPDFFERRRVVSGVRKLLDEANKTPVAQTEELSIGRNSGEDDDEDMPAAAKQKLDKLRIDALHPKGDIGGAGGSGGSLVRRLQGMDVESGLTAKTRVNLDEIARVTAVVNALLKDTPSKDIPGKDIPGKDVPGKDVPGKDVPGKDLPGVINAQVTTSRLAVVLQKRLDETDVEDPAVDPGKSPAIKPSGIHILEIVKELQKPVARKVYEEPNFKSLKVGVPVDNLERLDELKQSLVDIKRLLSEPDMPLIAGIEKIISPASLAEIKQRVAVPADLTKLLEDIAVDVRAYADPGDHPNMEPEKPGGGADVKGIVSGLRGRIGGAVQVLSGAVKPHPEADPLVDKPTLAPPGGDDVGRSVKERTDGLAADVKERVRNVAKAAVRQRIEDTLVNAEGSLDQKLEKSLAAVTNKVTDGVGRAFEKLKERLGEESGTHAAASLDRRRQANEVPIPERRYENYDCHSDDNGCCEWWKPCSCSRWETCQSRETAQSIAERKEAFAKQRSLNANADAEAKMADKFAAAAGQMDAKKREVLDTVASIMADSGQVKEALKVDTAGAEEGGDEEGEKRASEQKHVSNPHAQNLDHPSVLQHVLETSGITLSLNVSGAINAAIGHESQAEQSIASIGSAAGHKVLQTIVETDSIRGPINAAIGSESVARQIVASIGALDEDENLGPLFADWTVGEAINAAIGAKSWADMRLAGVEGSITGTSQFEGSFSGPINAAIGFSTDASMWIGNVDGRISGAADLLLTAQGPINAAIGSGSSSSVLLGNLGPKAGIGGNYDAKVTQSAGTVSAAIGYKTNSLVDVGNIAGSVGRNAKVDVSAAPIISAALGASSRAETRVAGLGLESRVGGNLALKSSTGPITTFSLGVDTTARTEVAVVDADVSGNASFDVSTGEIMTGTIGINTFAETIVGSIKAPVTGDVNINVATGGIDTYSVGLSIGGNDQVASQTLVGNVLGKQNGPVTINMTSGSIYTLGIGLIIEIPLIGSLKFIWPGCTSIANVGGSGCR